jgi:hypothetical protein
MAMASSHFAYVRLSLLPLASAMQGLFGPYNRTYARVGVNSNPDFLLLSPHTEEKKRRRRVEQLAMVERTEKKKIRVGIYANPYLFLFLVAFFILGDSGNR